VFYDLCFKSTVYSVLFFEKFIGICFEKGVNGRGYISKSVP
jgi:hypothetical protein